MPVQCVNQSWGSEVTPHHIFCYMFQALNKPENEHLRLQKCLLSLFSCSILLYFHRSLQIEVLLFLLEQVLNLFHVNIFIRVKVWGVARKFQKWLCKLKLNLQINCSYPLQSSFLQELYTHLFFSATFGSILWNVSSDVVTYTAGPPPVTQNVPLSANLLQFGVGRSHIEPNLENKEDVPTEGSASVVEIASVTGLCQVCLDWW